MMQSVDSGSEEKLEKEEGTVGTLGFLEDEVWMANAERHPKRTPKLQDPSQEEMVYHHDFRPDYLPQTPLSSSNTTETTQTYSWQHVGQPSNTTETYSWLNTGSTIDSSTVTSNSLVLANQPVILPPELAAPWDSYMPLLMTPTTYGQYVHNLTMWNRHIGIVSHKPIDIRYDCENEAANVLPTA